MQAERTLEANTCMVQTSVQTLVQAPVDQRRVLFDIITVIHTMLTHSKQSSWSMPCTRHEQATYVRFIKLHSAIRMNLHG